MWFARMLRASCTAPCPALRASPAADLEMTSAEIFPGRESHPWSTCAWSQSYAPARADFKFCQEAAVSE
jgi:hypothetical protein